MRRGWGSLLALLVVAGLAGCGLSQEAGHPASSPTGAAATPSGPGSGVLAGTGPEAAAVAGGKLFLIRGTAQVAVPTADPVYKPAWSHDGAWLAYALVTSGDREETRVVRADGTDDHPLAGVTEPFAWSPVADLLAYADAQVTLTVVAPTGTAQPLVGAGAGRILSFAWSPDGGALAYGVSRAGGGPDGLFSVTVDGGHFTRWPVALTGDTGLILAGWWPGGAGVLAWTDPLRSASLAADGVPLISIDPSGAATTLATTLPDPAGIAWAPGGQRFAVAAGGDREAWSPRTLEICSAPPHPVCRAVPQPAGTTSLEPAWGPGSQIAFVRAPARGSPAAGTSLVAWYPTRELWVEAPDGSGARKVTGGGVSAPAWTGSGGTLVYSTADGPASVPVAGGTPTILGQGLPVPSASPDIGAIVGKQPWDTVAVWASAPRAQK